MSFNGNINKEVEKNVELKNFVILLESRFYIGIMRVFIEFYPILVFKLYWKHFQIQQK